MTVHVRVPTAAQRGSARGRRFRFAEQPAPRTLCGEPPTDKDWLVSDLHRSTDAERRRFDVCGGCVAKGTIR